MHGFSGFNSHLNSYPRLPLLLYPLPPLFGGTLINVRLLASRCFSFCCLGSLPPPYRPSSLPTFPGHQHYSNPFLFISARLYSSLLCHSNDHQVLCSFVFAVRSFRSIKYLCIFIHCLDNATYHIVLSFCCFLLGADSSPHPARHTTFSWFRQSPRTEGTRRHSLTTEDGHWYLEPHKT